MLWPIGGGRATSYRPPRQQETPLSADAIPVRRRSRLGLYLPVILLGLLVVGWSIAWFVIRERTRTALETWVGQEASAGRRWSCGDRTFGGFPFRMEIRCGSFALDRPDVHVSLGKLLVVSQVYQPRLIIAEASGPLQVQAGNISADGTWQLLQASVHLTDGGFERVSLVADQPATSLRQGGDEWFGLSSSRFEAHLRPEPGKPAAYDLAFRSDGALLPGLDDLIGGSEPADIAGTLDVTETDDLPARPLWSELERWRNAGGKVDLTALTLKKGQRRLEATGALTVDPEHRPAGTLNIRAANLGGLMGRLANVGGVGGLLGALLGGGAPPPPAATGAGSGSGAPPLTPLPPLRIEAGRLYLGPIAVPGVRIPALY